jgi:hypothetical protein
VADTNELADELVGEEVDQKVVVVEHTLDEEIRLVADCRRHSRRNASEKTRVGGEVDVDERVDDRRLCAGW